MFSGIVIQGSEITINPSLPLITESTGLAPLPGIGGPSEYSVPNAVSKVPKKAFLKSIVCTFVARILTVFAATADACFSCPSGP